MNEVEKALSHNLREVREKKGYTLKDVVKGTGYYHAAELAEREIREEIDNLRMNKMFPVAQKRGNRGRKLCG